MVHIENPSTSGTFSLLEWIGDRLSPLAKLRDGLLVTAVIVYILGYLVWSLNAWVNNLGLLPALDFQYFVAGIFPALLIWLVYIGVRNGRRLSENFTKWLDPDAKGRLRYLQWFIRLINNLFWWTLGGKIILQQIEEKSGIAVDIFSSIQVDISIRTILFIAVFVLVMLPFYFVTKLTRFSRLESLLYCYFALIGACVVGLGFYTFAIYPQLPQALGGLRPRCVYLDVKKAEMSNEALKDIFPADAIKSSSGVVRSVKVDIFFSGGEFMRVRPHVEKQGVTPRVYKIRKGIVQAVVSCK